MTNRIKKKTNMAVEIIVKTYRGTLAITGAIAMKLFPENELF